MNGFFFTSIIWASMYIKSKLRMISSVFSLSISFFFVNYKVTKSLRCGKVSSISRFIKNPRIPICSNHFKKTQKTLLIFSPEIHPKKLTRKITQKPSPLKVFEPSKKTCYNTSQMFCFEDTVFENKTFKKRRTKLCTTV